MTNFSQEGYFSTKYAASKDISVRKQMPVGKFSVGRDIPALFFTLTNLPTKPMFKDTKKYMDTNVIPFLVELGSQAEMEKPSDLKAWIIEKCQGGF